MAKQVPVFAPGRRDIERNRALAQMLLQQSQAGVPEEYSQQRITPKYSIGQGLTQLAAGLASGLATKRADRQEDQYNEGLRSQNDALLRDVYPDDPGSGSLVADQTGNLSTQGGGDGQRKREFLSRVLQGQDPQQVRQLLTQQALARLSPKEDETIKLGKDERAFKGGKVIAEGVKSDSRSDFERSLESLPLPPEQKQAILQQWLQKQSTHAPTAATNVNVNTEKSLYGTMAEKQGSANVDLYQQAQKAPELIARATRVKQALQSEAITGAGANWLLAGAKVANQLGFNTGNAAADTEALARDLAASTLDAIKSSGLGAGSGFSNADRDFLEKVVGGKITLEGKTLSRLADLNAASAAKTIERWNSASQRLDQNQLRTLGMGRVDTPTTIEQPKTKLSQNPDGSWTYTP